MTRELEDAEDAEDAQRDERSAEVLVVCDAEPDVIRKNRYDVNYAHHRPNIPVSVGRREQSQHVLAGEDHYAGRVQTEQFHLKQLAAWPAASSRRDAVARNSFGDVDDDRNSYEEAGHIVEDEGRCAALWVLERPPHALS